MEAAGRTSPSRLVVAATTLGAWLLLAPTTWTWADSPDLPAWNEGAAVATAAAAIGLARNARRLPVTGSFGGPDPELPSPTPVPPWVLRASLALLGLSLVALVASTVRAS